LAVEKLVHADGVVELILPLKAATDAAEPRARLHLKLPTFSASLKFTPSPAAAAKKD